MKFNSIFSGLILFVMLYSPIAASAALPPGFETETLVSGLTLPTSLAFAPDGRIFIAEKDGTVRIYKNGALLSEPLIKLTDVNNYGDRGLIGMAIDPDFASNGYIYLSYTYENTPGANYAGPKTGRIVRVTVVGDSASESSKFVLVGREGGTIANPSCQNFPHTTDCVPSDSSSHSVGGLRFGFDGKLYASLGDGSNFDYVDPQALRAQNLDSLAGKLLRINTDGTAPADNPFYNGDNTANRSKVYAYGLRNMYRFNFKPGTNMLFGGDVGWSSWEEINKIIPGGNYGWPCREGVAQTVGYGCDVASPVSPFYYYAHDASGAGAVTAGAFPTGSAYPAQYANTFFFGDYAQNWIKQIAVSTGGSFVSVGNFASESDSTNGPVEFVTGPEGNIYFLAIYTGELKRITHTSGNRRPIVAISATPSAGLTPLAVNFSSAGTNDPDGDPISYSWNFGDGATSAAANPSHAYTQNGRFTALLTVRDDRGGVQTQSIVITAGNQKPTGEIISPAPGSLYAPHQSLTLSGAGSDAEDGALPSGALSWRVILHHNTHAHTLETHTGNNITFSGADHGDPAVYTEVELTVTDSAGLTNTTSVNIYLDNSSNQTGNLVQNPSFEETDPLDSAQPLGWTRDWWGNLGTVFTYPVPGFEGAGSRAARVQVTSYTEGDAKWTFSPIFVEGNTQLTFSDHYMSDATSIGVAQIGLTDGTRQYINLGEIPPASAWTQWSGTLTTPPNTRFVSIFHLLSEVGTLTIDNVSLQKGTQPPPPPPPSPSQNLIANPSFETASGVSPDSPLGWARGGWGTNDRSFFYPVLGRNGGVAVQTKLTSYTDGDTKWYPNNIAVSPGSPYIYSDWYKADDISDVIGAYTMNDNSIVYFGVVKDLPPAADWRQATGSFVPPAGVKSVTFYHLISSPATLTIDDVSLTTSTSTAGDTERPVVTITAPAASSTVSSTVSVAANAIDNIGVASVEFSIDGTPVGTDTTIPYGATWDTSAYANGAHVIAATARDAAGLSDTKTISVTVSNATTTNSNLIANPSFENTNGAGDPISWLRGNWGTNNAVFMYPISGPVTPKAAQLQITTYTDGDAKWYFAPAEVTPLVPYRFSDTYRSDVATQVVARFTLADGTFRYTEVGTAPASAGWTTWSGTITPPDNAAQLTVFHVLRSIGTLSVDDYSLVALSGSPTSPDLFDRGMVSLTFDDGWLSHYTEALPILNGANMKGSFEIVSRETLGSAPGNNRILNPSLEVADAAGEPAEWFKGNWGTNDAVFTYLTTGGQTGSRAARVTMNSYVDGDAKWYFKDIAAIDGANYTISDYYMSDVPTTVTARYNMGNNVYVYQEIASLPPASTWTQFSRQLTLPPNVESFTFFHHLNSVGNLSIDNASFSQAQTFVTPSQVLTMRSQGHEIGAHTRTHTSLTSLSPVQQSDEMAGSRNDLLAMGVDIVNMIVYPYGDYDTAVKNTAVSSGFIGGRSADGGQNLRSTDKFALKVKQIEVTTTVAEIQSLINTAVANKTWLILMFHQVDTSGMPLSITPSNLRGIIDHLRTNNVPVVTMAEGVTQMN